MEFIIDAHPVVYSKIQKPRKLRIAYELPEQGVSEATSICILVAGFGANMDANVYKKMRRQFADTYNMVTVQCEYFGTEFMQDIENIRVPNAENYIQQLATNRQKAAIRNGELSFLEFIGEQSITLPVSAIIEESEENFNDMGLMQAIDLVTTIEVMKLILQENNLLISNKVIGWGQSHGAYLLHFANVIAPHLFTTIIDNSAWVAPVYYNNSRFLSVTHNKSTLVGEFTYKAKSFLTNDYYFSLFDLYKNTFSEAFIYSCLGTSDNLVEVQEKELSLQRAKNYVYEVIDESKVDGQLFKSTTHGLDADFLLLMSYVESKYGLNHANNLERQATYSLKIKNTVIDVDYSYGLPVFNITEQGEDYEQNN